MQRRSYPRSFGRAVAALADLNLHPAAATDGTTAGTAAASFAFLREMVGEDLWDDARMSDVLQYLWKNRHLHLDF